ncbi:PEP-CTERM sorting domain-containing protein [bacterium]|nr:PEP-CTERM sorting domain-containing protein [bacterium]
MKASRMIVAATLVVTFVGGWGHGAPVTLQQATATIHQITGGGNGWPVQETIDTITAGLNGMGFEQSIGANTIVVWETATDLVGPGLLTFDIDMILGGTHTLQRFRLAATDADRSLYADGNPPPLGTTIGDVDPHPEGFALLAPMSITSVSGATFTVGPNNIITVSGAPAADTYTITARSPLATVTGLRMEVLPGPNGRIGFYGPTGNAVVSEVSVDFAPGGPLAGHPMQEVPLQNATADFDQGTTFTIGSSIDSTEHGANGWGIFGQQGTPHEAVFQTVSPLDAQHLVFELNFASPWGEHKMQKFRLSYTTDPNPTQGDGSITWTDIVPRSVLTSLAGSSALINLDNTIDIIGTGAVPDMYQVLTAGDFGNITGFRLEALLGANGLVGFSGGGGNGNFVFSEFNVFAMVPEPATMTLLAFGGLGALARRRRRK